MNKWVLGARPRTLSAAIAPVLIASALAGSEFNWFRAALALKVAVWLQIGVNYANDYSDGVKGTDENRVGPTRLVASGLASAKAVKNAAFISFAIASIAGLWLSLLTSPLLILIGILAIAAAWGYTGGKNPYGYSGLGEVSVFTFFGLVATMGTYYVQTEKITVLAFIVAISNEPLDFKASSQRCFWNGISSCFRSNWQASTYVFNSSCPRLSDTIKPCHGFFHSFLSSV